MSEAMTVIFDLGRVLLQINTKGARFSALMVAMGIPPNQAFSLYWKEPEVEWHMTGKITTPQFYQAAIDRYNLKISYEDFATDWCDLFSPMPGMEHLFDRIAEKHRVGLLSDTDPLHWAKAKEILPWLSRIEHPTLSFETGYLKPHPAAYLKAAENCATPPENCFFIDDTQDNVDGARAVGMAALTFQNPERLAKDLAKLGIL